MAAVLAIVLALGAAALAAVGTVMRQHATMHPGSRRQWWVGAALSVVAFGLQVTALVFGSVLLVQPLIVLSVLFELLIQARATKRAPTGRQWWSAAGVAAGVAALIVFARPVPAPDDEPIGKLDLVFLGFLAAVLTAYLVARRARGALSAVLYGLVSGSLFGLVAVQINGMSGTYRGVVPLAQNPTLYICIVTTAGAILAQQKAFTASRLEASYPAMVASEPVVSMVLSMAVLGEQLSSRSVGTYVGVAGLAAMVVGVITLARTTATSETASADAGAVVDAVNRGGARERD